MFLFVKEGSKSLEIKLSQLEALKMGPTQTKRLVPEARKLSKKLSPPSQPSTNKRGETLSNNNNNNNNFLLILQILLPLLILIILMQALPFISSRRIVQRRSPVIDGLNESDASDNDNLSAFPVDSPAHDHQPKSNYNHNHDNHHHRYRYSSSTKKHQNKSKHRNHPHNKDKHKNNWCSQFDDCPGLENHDEQLSRICGSDRKWYRSMCDLKREACLKNIHLFKRPHEYCYFESEGDKLGKRMDELRGRCNRAELLKLKTSLLQDFNGDLKLMFRYFDMNSDNLVEAHELWPRSSDNQTSSLYNINCEEDSLQLKKSPSCWLHLDFPFEPFNAMNGCSLSHLILLDLPSGKFSFNLETLTEAFTEALDQYKAREQPSALKLSKRIVTERLALGDSKTIKCLAELKGSSSQEENGLNELEKDSSSSSTSAMTSRRCLWTRYNTNLASIRDPHLSIRDESLFISDAQLYLSGQYRCQCHLGNLKRSYQLELSLQVLAEARVQIRPKFQWSLAGSRVAFECLHDHIDTTIGHLSWNSPNEDQRNETSIEASVSGQVEFLKERLRVEWLSGQQRELIIDRETNHQNDNGDDDGKDHEGSIGKRVSQLSQRASISMASSGLILESIKLNDSGQITCRASYSSSIEPDDQINIVTGEDTGTLLVEQQPLLASANENELYRRQEKLPIGGSSGSGGGFQQQNFRDRMRNNYFWLFHDNGISIYKLAYDDGQEMELLKEINGQSLIKAEVDGNWNQLTLCGGLNSEQAVICEWSDNAIQIEPNLDDSTKNTSKPRKRYLYVGQPNLNRLLIMDCDLFEIVAIINTEPQPRRLFLYKPSKIHLSKWVRRRLSPAAIRRWMGFGIERGHAHPLRATPINSKLYSMTDSPRERGEHLPRYRERSRREAWRSGQQPQVALASIRQFDIWLLCYGQPLVVNPSGDSLDMVSDYSLISENSNSSLNEELPQPFTPRLPPTSWPSISSQAINLESRLRNRESVHIIQSSFLPIELSLSSQHDHELDHSDRSHSQIRRKNLTTIGQFQHSTVLTTHHIYRAYESDKHNEESSSSSQGKKRNFDLIHQLIVPPKPYSLENENRHKIHYAYMTHYNEQSLFRVNMDEYKYDKEIDLQDCDPLQLITTAQGLLIVQCRSKISHNLIGQLVLDELTSSRIEFNANIRAQESYLSPDNRYLISIHSSTAYPSLASSSSEKQSQDQQQSIVYVQSVGVGGLKLEYEIKTLSLEIGQCAFVWKEGYYAAIFVSSNSRDQQSEILSLRLADGRLELIARVPGLMSPLRHKDQLIVSSELRLAALTSSQGTYVVDLEENRVLQTLRRHQTPPTLLWVP